MATLGETPQPLLSDDEHKALKLTTHLWDMLCRIADNGPSRQGDLAEAAGHIHVLQRAILAQAGARAFPDLYRPLGGEIYPARPRVEDPLGDLPTVEAEGWT